jgi:cytochrome P450
VAEPQTRPELEALPTLSDYGFTGGRDGLRAFAARAFQEGAPRFLRTDKGELAVFRNRDLQQIGAMPEVGAVPPAVLFGAAFEGAAQSPPPPGAALAAVIANQVFTANPPIHRPVRKSLVAQLGPKQTSAMEPLARDVVRAILDTLSPNDHVDVVDRIAERLTCGFWGRMLDMAEDEVDAMIEYVRDLTPMFHLAPDVDDVLTFDRGARGYRILIERAAERSLARDGTTWLAQLAADLDSIDIPDDPACAGIVPQTVGALLAGNLIDGFHTAALAAANTLYALAIRPGMLERVAKAPELLPNVIFEALRLEPPVLMLKRWALADIDLDGYRVPRGSVLALLWGAGGLDPEVFDAPLDFDPARSRRGSTTFGGGAHLCPGRYVAVMLVRILLEGMVERGWRLRPMEAPDWLDGHVMGQMRRFAVLVEGEY